jgi:hypothetical protein
MESKDFAFVACTSIIAGIRVDSKLAGRDRIIKPFSEVIAEYSPGMDRF